MGSKGEQYATLDLNDECFSSDHFRMYEFKVKRCPQARPHDWTRCPFAHPGEKAKRRDPLKFQYGGAACPEFRKSGCCRRGDACPFAHGVFECWCHPSRYRTQICTDGTNCKRRVCFFAHLEAEVRKPDDLPMAPNGTLHLEPAAEVQQQMEVAQAYQVLLNASTQNQGGRANFEALQDFSVMQQHVAAGLPPSSLAEHAAQLQHQLRQLQALQNIQLVPHVHPHHHHQQQQQKQIPGDYDLNYHGPAALLDAPTQVLQQAQASPFAQSASHGLPGGYDSGLGHDLSNLSLSMSLPNPNSMRPPAQVSTLHSAHTASLESFSGAIGSGSGGIGAAVDRTLCQLSVNRPSNASSSSPFQMDALGGLPRLPQRSESGPFIGGGGFSHGTDVAHFSGSGGFPRPSLSAALPVQGNPMLGGSPHLSGRLGEGNGFSPLVPNGFPAGQPIPMSRPEQRHSQDVSLLNHHQASSRIPPLHVGGSDCVISPFVNEYNTGIGSSVGPRNRLQSLASATSGLPSGPQSFTAEGALGGGSGVGRSGGLMERASSAGPGYDGFQYMDRSGSGSYGVRPSRSWQQQQQQPMQQQGRVQQQQYLDPADPAAVAVASPAEALRLPLSNDGPNATRLGDVGLIPDKTGRLGDARVEASMPFVGAVAGHPGVSGHTMLQNTGEAPGKQGNVYHSMGRPPAIREDQQLEAHCFDRLPPMQHQERKPPQIGRNTSFDSILAELPRSLSEVGMSKERAHGGAYATEAPAITED